MRDCSLYRYEPRLGDVAAAALDRAVALMATSTRLRDAVRAGSGRIELTQAFQAEGVLERVTECAEPQVRIFADGSQLELALAAQQPEVCLQLVQDARLAARGIVVTPLHVTSGQQRCGMSANFIPKALVLGRATEAGRMIAGSNTVTLAKPFRAGAVAPAATATTATSQCVVQGQPGPAPAHTRAVDALPGNHACTFGVLTIGSRVCKSLHDSTVTCTGGDPARECQAAIQQVRSALSEFAQKQARLPQMRPEERVDLLERLLAVTELDKLAAAVPAYAQQAQVHRQQVNAVARIMQGGVLNMVPGHEAAEQPKYEQIDREMLTTWVPQIAALRQLGETAEDVWARLTPNERWAHVRLAYGIVNQALGLRPRPLSGILDQECATNRLLAGAYVNPSVAPPRADTLFLCPANLATVDLLFSSTGRSTAASDYFGDLTMLLETLLHETMHAYHMERVNQVFQKQVSASAGSCTHARMLAAGWSADVIVPTGCDKWRPSIIPAHWFNSCFDFYRSEPPEFEARFFSERATAAVLQAMREPRR